MKKTDNRSAESVAEEKADLSFPRRRRHCTDSLCLLLLLGVWLGMSIVGLASMGFIQVAHLKKGDPDRLLHGVDYMGNICGVDQPVQSLSTRIMPNFYGANPTLTGDYVPPLLAVCVPSCPDQDEIIVDPYGTYSNWKAAYDSKDFLNNCLYVQQGRDSTSATTVLSDFARTAGLIAILGFLIAVICSMLFLLVIRIPLILRFIVWFCVFFILALLAAGGYLLLNEAKDEDYNRTEVLLLQSVGGILATLAVIWLCVICFMRQRIALAISLIRESAAALTSMPLLCFVPLLQTVCFAGFTALWMLYCFYLVSSGDVETHTDEATGFSYKTVSYDRYAQRAIIFMLFAWLWSIGFLEAIGQLGSAHAVLTWFFAEVRSDITSLQVWSSVLLVTRYHSGTAAAGSFIIAVIRGLRMTLEYVKYRLGKKTDRLTKFILCCMSCLLLMFEKVVKFLNKHAYIQCAMHGSGFFVSATKAYFLLFKNLGRLAAVSVVGDFVVLIGKLSITLTCAGASYLYMSTYMRDELNGFVLPTIFVAFLAFVTSTMFLGVLSATADALLQAVIVDEEESKRSKGYKSAAALNHEGLRDLVINKSKEWKLNEENDPLDEEELQGLADSLNDEEGDAAFDPECPNEPRRIATSPMISSQVVDRQIEMQTFPSNNSQAGGAAGPMFAPGSRYSKGKSSPPVPPPKPSSAKKTSSNPFDE